MRNFFKLHREKIIGYKALTDADLGRKTTSHQTHIGLFDDVLTFLPNQRIIDDSAMLIYENNTEILSLNFNRIQNPDGTFRSPKINMGGRDTISVASTIRDISKRYDEDLTWYIFWFGLESGQTVFWLFNESSSFYADILKLGLSLNPTSKGRVTETSPIFNEILLYIEKDLDNSTKNLLQELEIETQLPGKLITENKIRKCDIVRAQQLFSYIGQKGEEFVAEYFDKLKYKNQIVKYNWVNKSSESGYPYDFCYQDLSDNIIYLDVKTTKFDFDQKIIYSGKEIEFALSVPNQCYNIYRVYNLTENDANLRICKDCSTHFGAIYDCVSGFSESLNSIETNIQSVNFAFQPNIEVLTFEPQILLNKN